MERPLLGLIGANIQHSLTPAMQEAAGRALGLDLRYHLVDTARLPAPQREAPHLVPRLLDGVRLLGFAGVNITHPWKQAVLAHLDAVSPDAARIGAVNTVLVRDGTLVGHNTDHSGFVGAWRLGFGARAPGTCALLGAGGAGRAIAHGLLALGARALRIVDADRSKAEALAAALAAAHPGANVTAAADATAAAQRADGVVNATPIGMHAYPGVPLPVEALAGAAWAVDAVYTPLETEFLRAARRAGAAVMTGQEMAVGQAADAFALFFGRPGPRDLMRAVFLERLGVMGGATLKDAEAPGNG